MSFLIAILIIPNQVPNQNNEVKMKLNNNKLMIGKSLE